MSLAESRGNLCRVCLKDTTFFEWIEAIFEFTGPSYKECYFGYTHLDEEDDDDSYTQMICVECATDLRNTYQLVEKALSSDKKLKLMEIHSTKPDKNVCRVCLEDNVFFEWIEAIFEFSGPSYKWCYYQYTRLKEGDNPFFQMICVDCANVLRNAYQLVQKALVSDKKLKVFETYNIGDEFCEIEQDFLDKAELMNASFGKQIIEKTVTDMFILNNQRGNVDKNSEEQELLENSIIINNLHDKEIQNKNTKPNNGRCAPMSASYCDKIKAKKLEPGLQLMCMYCSKICTSVEKLKNHERTHEKRERTESCPICGLKFYDKLSLRCHMQIHEENRERKYKCEFCTKAFFNRGGLNVHRRIHLGLMLKCQLCPKEYCRQIDLDRHMQSHDSMRITAEVKKKTDVNKTKIIMDCKTCGRKIFWENWETHKSKHLKQPQFQCRICDKTYYIRKSASGHLKRSHNMSKDQFEKFIVKINKKFRPRLSSLMKQQNIKIE